jgi:rubrerythrin
LLAGGAATALGLVLTACGDDDEPATTMTTEAKSGGDLDILNYALTLEYLEAQFYADVVESGVITDRKLAAVAQQFGESEQQHVDALVATIKQLGGTPASKPKASFMSVIDGGQQKVLETAASVENLGAGAYLAEAPKIESPDILAAALGIHSVEARHAAALDAVLGNPRSGAFAKPIPRDEVMKAIEPFLTA